MDSVNTHVLTIQVEDYYQVAAFKRLIPAAHWQRFEARVRRNTERILDWLDETDNRATFFTSGWLAARDPELAALIVERGHEVACQGYYSEAITDLPPPVFRNELRRSRAAVEAATGVEVRGFRIGRGWIGRNDRWALDILAEEGFAYDSSARPIGRDGAREPGHGIIHRLATAAGELWEVPVSSAQLFGWSWPISGGNYIRQFPDSLIRHAQRRWIQQHTAPFVFYFHVWEVDPKQPIITAAPLLQRIRHYRNLHGMPERIRGYLSEFRFQSIADALDLTPPRASAPPVAEPVLEPVSSSASAAPVAVASSPGPALTLVIPCYNEVDAIPYLARTLREFEREAPFELHLVFVDDGSQDDTSKVLREHFGDRDVCQILRHDVNQGIGAGVLSGARASTTELIAVLDADCTFDPHQLPAMFALLEDDVAVVVASPLHGDGGATNVPAWRLLLSRGAAFLYQCVMRNQLTSYTSCFRIYRRGVLEHIALSNTGFAGMAEILAHLDLEGHQIAEYPAVLETRLLGQSKINTLRTIAEHLRLVARLAAARWLNRPFMAADKDRSQ